jgi:uncharacterized protein YbbK (DUF523 family)
MSESLNPYFEFKSFCPKLDIGFSVPQKSIHLVQNGTEDPPSAEKPLDLAQ